MTEPRENTTPADGPPPAPRWVKLFGLAALALVLLFVILHATGNGFGPHGGWH